ncbi:DUF2231 domain-containing protein [Paractinoplanes atraurantiacus]|uniref:DUF2231 domain-containing protein n=1 Tax=Paractinoplanes atraurantiacus TaxID=1036182 RepID=A0A285JJ82_9ACTN|nr:DUF2231 domain-containing protein [Actinoplanes atraurantiacus]SNY59436.1 hypothetical protein SAMN05421748_120137 [Actinoplanes atraurantiacus]
MSTINGLPAHILLVHAVVVLLPLSAFLLVLTAWWPAARSRLAGPNAVLSAGVVALVPLTTSAGEWLERRVPPTELVHRHAELGDTALFYAVPVAALALIVWWRRREESSRRTYLAPASPAVTYAVAALSVAVAVAGVYGTYRIGDSGSKAAWTGTASATSRP